MIAADEFLEYADVFGNCYGTARRFLREAQERGNDLLLDIDVQGAEQIQQKIPEAVRTFLSFHHKSPGEIPLITENVADFFL